jgi:hypothetical protein
MMAKWFNRNPFLRVRAEAVTGNFKLADVSYVEGVKCLTIELNVIVDLDGAQLENPAGDLRVNLTGRALLNARWKVPADYRTPPTYYSTRTEKELHGGGESFRFLEEIEAHAKFIENAR